MNLFTISHNYRKVQKMAPQIVFRAEFFREEDFYVGVAPELCVSSFGETLEEAERSLKEAVEAFLEGCKAMGTLEEVLEGGRVCKEGASVVSLATCKGRITDRIDVKTENHPHCLSKVGKSVRIGWFHGQATEG